MYRKIAAALAVLCTAAALALAAPGTASAAQTGSQTITVQSTSWSSLYVQFACGASYNVPVGQTWGEGYANPTGCTGSGDEPAYVYVGAGWCVTRWVIQDGFRHGNVYYEGGGTGGWMRAWDISRSGSYEEHVESWYGSWCPTTGAAYQTD
jgi:hypothetical protein